VHRQGGRRHEGAGGGFRGGSATILIIDNYDSFSYNLYQMIGSMGGEVEVARNDAVSVGEVEEMGPSHIVLSPGPGRPEGAGICVDLVRRMSGKVPILGVCLGHQAVCEAFGAPVIHARSQMHGKQSEVRIYSGNPLFAGLPDSIMAGRYHSLAADPDGITESLRIIGRAADGEIMAVCHKSDKTYGVQFHPESVLTPDGKAIVANFLRMRSP
jgi:anthranilate synthase component 2